MNEESKVAELRELIRCQLLPLIDSNYWLLDVPYHQNIGDTLIWQGEREFLHSVKYRCKGTHSFHTFTFPHIPQSDIILFHGGGNFGDLWTIHHDFRMKVISHYPNNRFIVLPQTVFFEKEENLTKSADFYSKYDNVTICARDRWSYDLLKTYFQNNILLVPDMAFHINAQRTLQQYCTKSSAGDLLVKRIDKEYKPSDIISELESRDDIPVTDWPSYVKPSSRQTEKLMNMIRSNYRCRNFLFDLYASTVYRNYLIRIGTELLSSYERIYTTRLHAAILGVLVGKDVMIIDNSYGKNSHFYETWFTDCDNVSLYK